MQAPKTDQASVLMTLLKALMAILSAWAVYSLLPGEVMEPARRMAAIFALAMVLWLTEAIPLFATSLVVLALQAWWIILPFPESPDWTYAHVFNAFSDPVIFLFLGGFILAKAVEQERIDVQLAALMLRAFGHRPGAVLGGVMVITAIFSMWMSNTATTAMMIVLAGPLLRQVPEGDPFRRGLILSIPFAANIGGIGTPIGSPPNAIALAQLDHLGHGISFLQWMLFAVPLTLCALAAVWVLLLLMFRPKQQRLKLHVEDKFVPHARAIIVYVTFFTTVTLWLTSEWHGAPVAVVAMLPAVVLTMVGIIGKQEFNSLEWNILILIAGGIALGDGMVRSGLDVWILGLAPADLSPQLLIALLTLLAVVMSTVISNTVAANVLLPLGLAAATAASALEQQTLAVMIALGTSFAMGLPISTPPNAIAYATGQCSSREMLIAGGLTSLAASAVIVLTGPYIIPFFLA